MSISKLKITSLAKEASEAFLTVKKPLDSSICEIADREDLTDHHIRRIAEMANMAVRQHLYSTPEVEQHKVVFDLADPENVISVRAKASGNEVPIVHSDYLQPPRVHIFEQKSDTVPDPEEVDGKVTIIIQEKKASINEDVQRAYIDWQESQTGFFEEIKDQLRAGDITGGDICKMASAIDDQEALRAMMDKVITHVYGIDKEAASNLANLINEDLKVTYVLGDHPLVIKYKDCVTASKRIRRDLGTSDNPRDSKDHWDRGLSKVVETGGVIPGYEKKANLEQMQANLDPSSVVSQKAKATGLAGKIGGIAGKSIVPVMYGLPYITSVPGEVKGNLPRWMGYAPTAKQKQQQIAKVLQTGSNIWEGPSDIEKMVALQQSNKKPLDMLSRWREKATLAGAGRE